MQAGFHTQYRAVLHVALAMCAPQLNFAICILVKCTAFLSTAPSQLCFRPSFPPQGGAGPGGAGAAASSGPQMSLDKHQLARLHAVLGPFMLRRVKADVVAEMVPKTEVRTST